MEKFSIYELLGLILPGALFVFFLNVFNKLFVVCDLEMDFNHWELFVGIYLCLIIIFGALLYISTFSLKSTFVNKIFKYYFKVSNIYHSNKQLHDTMSPVLNKKSQEWYNAEIFHNEETFKSLTDENKVSESKLIDKFYDRMYYELEYMKLIDTPKTFQSFYLFFRQILVASVILIILGIILWLISLCPVSDLVQPDSQKLTLTFIILVFCLVTSNILARWYRKRMALKMFWAYFTYLNHKNDKK